MAEDLKQTNMSRDQKVAFHKGLVNWDQKLQSLIEQKDKEIDDKLPAKKK